MSKSGGKLNLPAWPSYSEEEIDAVATVLREGNGNYWFGEHGKLFEKEFSRYCESSYALTAANGTLALEMALYALGIGLEDEVIVTPRSFVASANCIVLAGAKPVFADVDPDSQNITAETISEKITPKTRAIITVHLAGWPCEMNEILSLAKEKDLYVIEDCAQAHGAEIYRKKVGSFGHAAIFSFCHDKIISTGGEGGMFLTNDESIWARAAAIRNHGKDPRKFDPGVMATTMKGEPDTFGSNYRMTEMQSCIGRIQLRKLEAWLNIRRRNAKILDEVLANHKNIRCVIPAGHIRHAYYKYYFFVKTDKLKRNWDRSRIISEIESQGIPCSVGSTGEIYNTEAYVKGQFAINGYLPVAKQLGQSSIMLSLPPSYDEECMHSICDKVDAIIAKASV